MDKPKYSEIELSEAKRSIASTLCKCEKAVEKLREGTSQHTLTKRRIEAFRLAIALIDEKLNGGFPIEIALTGGRSTNDVVRAGNTVRRTHKDTNDFTNNVLLYLEKTNFSECHRYLGTDDQSRDVYGYIEGDVPDEIGFTTEMQLNTFMKIVKRFHDATQEIPGIPKGKVICHNDLSPCNTVFNNGIPIAIIDWDSAAVGERWEDLTYVLWLWINIGSHKRSEIDILGQMKKALSAYDCDEETQRNFADKLLWRMDKVVSEMPTDNCQYERTKDWVEFSKIWVKENKNAITEEIG